jgi:hypothetical protein
MGIKKKKIKKEMENVEQIWRNVHKDWEVHARVALEAG